ncbi:MAG: phenylalanine--tRNA ligase subunit alpha [Acidobacteriota bacterium]|nr:phenylalanine--tRNA ligase subunit alpha [Blastocatellia bacterium]MDW8412917.1 phenylalanine--tRNA ligase subunit alpha [Acidobacteriota bacterium]
MKQAVEQLKEQFLNDLQDVYSSDGLQQVRDTYFSRKSGRITLLMRQLGKLSPEERKEAGRLVNELRDFAESLFAERQQALRLQDEARRAESERLDVTLPGRRIKPGSEHPIVRVKQRIEDIFVSMGYSVEDGPEIDTTFYNFDALNIPVGHPARESQDTFYIDSELALRSQTSNIQIHAMQKRRPPIRIIAPGKVFRRDNPDPTHNPMFFQVEGLNVAEGIHMGHLKGTLQIFLEKLFSQSVRLRFRPSYFPFVEPGAETDFSCIFCKAESDCRVCKGVGWIELGGSGMVHPNVLSACGIDPKKYSGFAFGFGIDRMTAMLYGVDDIRNFFSGDLRFLEQF